MPSRSEFEKEAGQKRESFLSEFVQFLMNNKKWWMIPILLVLSIIGLLAALGPTGAAPFIYTLF